MKCKTCYEPIDESNGVIDNVFCTKCYSRITYLSRKLFEEGVKVI